MAITAIGNLQTSTVHVDEILSNLAQEFTYPDLIGERIAPLTPVDKKTNQYSVFYEDDSNRLVEDARGPGGSFNQVEWAFSKDSYNCEGHGLENTEPWETIANADDWALDYLNGSDIAARLKRMVLLNHEKKCSDILTTSGNFHADHYKDFDTVAGENWDEGTTNGLKLMQQYLRTMRRKSFGAPIKMVVSGDAWIEMQSDSHFIPTLTDSILASAERLRTALGIDEIIIADAQYNSADKGQAASRSEFWPGNCMWLLSVAPQGTGSRTPSALKTFQWSSPDLANRGEGVRVGSHERHMYRWIQYLKYYDVKATGVDSSDNLISAVWLNHLYAAI